MHARITLGRVTDPNNPEYRLSNLMPPSRPPAPPKPSGLSPEEYNRQAIKQGLVALAAAAGALLVGAAYLILAHKGYLPEFW